MFIKEENYKKAVLLRQQGKTYREIRKEVKVSKSTLSLWLRSVGLSEKHKDRIAEKRLLSAIKGGAKRHEQRISITNEIKRDAAKDIGEISTSDLRMIGSVLYWAEGAKAKAYNPSERLLFSNSDFHMVSVYLKWLKEVLEIDSEQITFDIYVHETAQAKIDIIRKFWAEKTGFNIGKFSRVYLKKDRLKTKRLNTQDNYHGQLRVAVKKSTNINRKVEGWIEEIWKQCGVV